MLVEDLEDGQTNDTYNARFVILLLIATPVKYFSKLEKCLLNYQRLPLVFSAE